jgi:hypothetical protein
VCNLCGVAGHWIQQCSEQRPKKKKKKVSTHVFVAGVDPSPADIEHARELQKIKPPNCFCGKKSRLKKVKRSNSKGGDQHSPSRAIGKYFFFCAKQKSDDSKCQFARPVEDELKPKKERLCTFFLKTGKCKKGDKCMFSHELANSGVAKGKQLAATKSDKKIDTNADPIEKDDNVDKSSSESNARPVEREGKDDKSSSSESDSDTGSDSDEDDDQQF